MGGEAVKLNRRLVLAVIAGAVSVAAGAATIALANPGNTLTTILGHRATLSDSVQVNDDRIKFQTKDAVDMVTQKVTFPTNGTSGWHFHPGVVLVVVESGHLTSHDASCQTRTYGPGEAFVESGTAPFMVSNENTTETAIDVATQVAPAKSPFRIEAEPPPCA
jgi:quercetin dioxygenase-like cupin family protein